MACGGIGDDGGKRGFAARSRGGRYGDEHRRFAKDAQQPTHVLNGLTRLGDARADDLGTVHDGSAADSDDGLGTAAQIKRASLLDILNGRIGNGFVIYGAGDGCFLQRILERLCQAEGADGRIRHKQNGGNRLFAKERHDGSQTVELHRLAIGKNRKRGTEHALKGATEKGIGFIHKISCFRIFRRQGRDCR